MRSQRAFVVTAVAFLFAMPIGQAQDELELCYTTGFDPPDFQPGLLHMQSNWLNSANTASIVLVKPKKENQEIQVLGSALVPETPSEDDNAMAFARLFPLFLPDGRYFFDATDQVIEISVDVKLEGLSTATTKKVPQWNDDLVSANLGLWLSTTNDPYTGKIVNLPSLILSSGDAVWVYDPTKESEEASYLASFKIKNLKKYHNLGAEIDFTASTTLSKQLWAIVFEAIELDQLLNGLIAQPLDHIPMDLWQWCAESRGKKHRALRCGGFDAVAIRAKPAGCR